MNFLLEKKINYTKLIMDLVLHYLKLKNQRESNYNERLKE